MKKMFCIILSLLFAASLSSSCITTLALMSASTKSSRNNISKETSYLSLKIIQTLGKGEALAVTEKYDIVKIASLSDIYYDGKRIEGKFTLLGTYTYQTKKGDWKTVPVFVRTSEYKKNKELWNRLLSETEEEINTVTTALCWSFLTIHEINDDGVGRSPGTTGRVCGTVGLRRQLADVEVQSAGKLR